MRRIVVVFLAALTLLAVASCVRKPASQTPPNVVQSQEVTAGEGDLILALTVAPTEVVPGQVVAAAVSFRNTSADSTLSVTVRGPVGYRVTATSATGTVVYDSDVARGAGQPAGVDYSEPMNPRPLVLSPGASRQSVLRFSFPVPGAYAVRALTEGTPSLTTPAVMVTVR